MVRGNGSGSMVESPCDGIGRHASFRNSCLRRVGSSPTGGNHTIEPFTRPKVLLGSLDHSSSPLVMRERKGGGREKRKRVEGEISK